MAGVSRWRKRRDYQDYLAWRTDRGFTATFEDMPGVPWCNPDYDLGLDGSGVMSAGRAATATES